MLYISLLKYVYGLYNVNVYVKPFPLSFYGPTRYKSSRENNLLITFVPQKLLLKICDLKFYPTSSWKWYFTHCRCRVITLQKLWNTHEITNRNNLYRKKIILYDFASKLLRCKTNHSPILLSTTQIYAKRFY